MKKRLFAGLLAFMMTVNLMSATASATEQQTESNVTEVVCEAAEDCSAETHIEECGKYVIPCTNDEECLAEQHVEGCPANVVYLPCLTEGCELVEGHDGECTGAMTYEDTVIDSEAELKAADLEEDQATVAQIGDDKYETLEEAFEKADEGDEIKLLADVTPTLTSQRTITKAAVIDLGGRTLTLTEDDLYFGTTTFENGNIIVDPSVKPSTAVFWMFANQTLTFDNVKLTATGVTGTYLIGLDGENSDLNLLNGSEIIVDNATALDLDIICVNSTAGNDIVINNSKVSVTNLDGRVFFRGNYTVSGNSDIDLSGITKAGFRIEAGQTLTIADTATVDITGEPRDGGIHLTDITATYTLADTATVNASVNKPVAVAEINGKGFATLEAAFDKAKSGDEVKINQAGTYALNTTGKDITITGTVDGVVFDNIGAKNMGGANVTFNHITFDYYPNVNYTGLQHSGNLVYNNCTFNGQVFLYGTSETFNECTFNQESSDAYNVWTYGAKEVEFNECTFNSAGKSVLIYTEAADHVANVTVEKSKFNASAAVEGKAAIEMDSSLSAGINLTIDAETTATGFGTGNVSGNSLWNNKKGDQDIKVVVNGEMVLKPAVTGLQGSGTAENPYLINDIDELIWFRDKVDEQAADGSTQFAGKYFKLTADIDLAGISWNPIGSMSGDHGSFQGIFDGGNHTISNLNVQQGGNGLGLFARTAGNAEIKNLTLNNVTVKSTDNSNYVGGVVGNSYASTKINNVHVTGEIDISGRGYIGGISGHGYVVMDNVSVVGDGTISSTFWCAGGILGYGGEGVTDIQNAHVEGITITSAAGGLGAIVGMAEDNNGTQPISGSDLSAKDVVIKTYTGAYGDAYANYALGALFGGNNTSELSGDLKLENVVVETSTGEEPEIVDIIAKIDNAYFYTVEDALKAVEDGQTITIMNKEGSEVGTELEFSKTGTFTITGYAPDYKMPIITVNNETGKTVLNIEDATLAMAEIDARKNATINVVDSVITGANGNDIVKAYYNGVINVSGKSEIDTMQVTVMGRLNLSDSAKITATWQTNVYGNGIITINEGAALDTAGLKVTGQAYSGRDNTDADRAGKPATILVDGGTLKSLDYEHPYYYNTNGAILGTESTNGLIEVVNGGIAELNHEDGIVINSGSEIKIDDGSFSAKSKAGTSVITNNGKIVMNNTVFDGAIVSNAGATVEINGGTVTNTDKEHSAIESTGTLTLSDVDITSARHAVRIKGGEAVINGGTYQVSGTAGMTTHAINVGGGTTEAKVIINGGTFIGPAGTAADSGSAVVVQKNATVEINDGGFGKGKNVTVNVAKDASAKLIVSSGKFDQEIPEEYLAEGKACVERKSAYDGQMYPYAVVDEESLKSEVVGEVKDNETYISENIPTEAIKIVKSLKADEYAMLASTYSVRDELASKAETEAASKAKLEAAGVEVDANTAITTIVRTYMKVVLKEVNKAAVDENGKTIVSFDIQMLYDVLATTATDPAKIITDPEAAGFNTVTVSVGNVVKNPEAAIISFELPADMIDEATDLTAKKRILYVEHLKGGKVVENPEADLEEDASVDTVSFRNDKGYSVFNLKISDKIPEVNESNPSSGSSGSHKDKDKDKDKNEQPVEVYYAGTAAPTAASAVNTGDSANIYVYVLLLVAAGVVISVVNYKKRKL